MSSSSTEPTGSDPTLTIEALRRSLVGRGREIEVVFAALRSGRHILLEGPPGELLVDKDTVMAEAADRATRAQSILKQQEQSAG